MRQNANINLIKIIACFLVLLNHTCFYLAENNYFNYFYKAEYVLCRIAVPLFIMSTGFLIGRKKVDFKYRMNTIWRVFLPLILITFFITFLRDKAIHISFFSSLLYDPIVEPYWYLYMLIGLYLFVPFLNKMAKNLKNLDIIILISLTLIIPALMNSLRINISIYFYETFFSYIIGYYFLGILLQRTQTQNYFLPSIFLFILSYGIGMLFFNKNNLSLFYIDHLLVISMSISFMIIMLNLKFSNHNKSDFIVNTTFGIYLLHPIVQNKIYLIMSYLNLNVNFKIFLYQIILFIFCMIIVICIRYIILILKKLFFYIKRKWLKIFIKENFL